MTDEATNFAALCNENPGGFNRAMGVRFLDVTPDQVVGELTITPVHHQPYGIVHGGVLAGVIETLCSVGAAIAAAPRKQSVVGVDNHTSFLKAVREGTLRITARPLTRGRRTQLWESDVRDADGRLIATGRVRLHCLDEGAELAGEVAGATA